MKLLLTLAALAASMTCAQKLPSWAGAGASYDSSASPHYSAWGAIAIPVSTALGAYSFTVEQPLLVNGKLSTSVTTGIDDILKTLPMGAGVLTVHGIGTLGVATTSTGAVSAFAGGGGLMYEFTKKVWILSAGFTVEAFALQNKAGSSAKPSVLLGIGKTF
jgi:hypothetical protein